MNSEEIRQIAEDELEAQKQFTHTIDVCVAAACMSSGAEQVKNALSAQVKTHGQEQCCKVRGVGCMGLCKAGPLVQVHPDGVMYQNVKPEDAAEIVEAVDKAPVTRLELDTNIPFFKRQQKIVLENSGLIDPERLEESLAVGGYEGLAIALTTMTPSEVIGEIVKSGLRGRGGAGYPTGLKWTTVAKATGTKKYVVCNADEGDPGAFMDRSVLESDPHRVLEGMAIAAYAVGADQGFIYVRAEYPLAIKRLQLAIRQAERAGVLGNSMCGTPTSFHVALRLGAGAFVCGEETALLNSIEGKRGTPRPRPPYPAEHGLYHMPTLINNVETFANIAPIVRRGGDWFASIGTEKSKGTKVFALAGRIENTGLIEVPMGITLREIVYEIGGGIPEGRVFKAVQTGGPSGGCIPEQFLDMPVDYDSLMKVGSIMGSGGMIVMDESSSMVDVARYFMEFCMSESCGKCIPCRVGTTQMYDLLNRILVGEGRVQDVALLEELASLVRDTSLCGLGQSAPNPTLSTLRFFRHEYDALVGEATAREGRP